MLNLIQSQQKKFINDIKKIRQNIFSGKIEEYEKQLSISPKLKVKTPNERSGIKIKNSFRETEMNRHNVVSPKNFKDIYNCYITNNTINNYLKNVKHEI